MQGNVEQADQGEPADQHEKRGISAMGQHLVDDHLEEQGRDEGEDLHEERGDQHMGERLAVAPQRGREPQEAEGARIDPGAAKMPRDEDQHGIGFGLQFVERNFTRDPGGGIDDPAIPAGVAPPRIP